MQTEIEVQRSTSAPGVPNDQQFESWVNIALEGRSTHSSLVIRIVDEAEAKGFNCKYRDKDYATNVLSFPAELPGGLPEEIRLAQLGDLLICAPVVAREAIERQRPETHHWAHLTIHGVLHLLGFDHEQADEARAMESLEVDILAKLGIPDPYLEI